MQQLPKRFGDSFRSRLQGLTSREATSAQKVRQAAAPTQRPKEPTAGLPPESTVPEAKSSATVPVVPPALASPKDFQAAILTSAEGLSIVIAVACQVAACSLCMQSISSAAAEDRVSSSEHHQQLQQSGLQQFVAQAGRAPIPTTALFAGQGALLALTLAWLCSLLSRRKLHQR